MRILPPIFMGVEGINQIEHFDTYDQVIEWMFVQLPNYQAQGTTAYKPGLENIQSLLDGIGHPEKKFKSIHIAGTNGKGSVAHMISAIYQANKYKVGTFTSPHISDFRERIKINGQMVSKHFVLDFVNNNRALIDQADATFFEINTAMAFQYFAENNVDIAIVETGLGGRLDSTNVLIPELSIITSIGIDHAEFLGDSLIDIAKEKGGIIKTAVPVVIGAEQSEVVEELSVMAINRHAPIHFPVNEMFDIDLMGTYQQKNAQIALAAVNTLNEKFPVKDDAIAYGLSHIVELTNLKGRFQLLQRHPIIILDAAHNPSGVEGLFQEIEELEFDQLHMLYGSASDKDLTSIFKQFPKSATYYFSLFNSKRTTSKERYQELGDSFELNYTVFDSPTNAIENAIENTKENDLIMIFGSFYMMDEILEVKF